ncbi:JAB domain-containing protein [Lysinibacillus sphaericus]|uniref:JAB domain-containing protein n=1 Tax=Lysinibacillus sphaericus TaxID=1421 RepID=UPI001CC181DA|nr:JAB domain-containing protein [Lysinibacillus sphaericus]
MQSSKRVYILSVKLVKESSMLYKGRRIRRPQDYYELFKQFLGEVDREYFVVMCLDTKNQPPNISVVHIGSLNASLVHPREIMKTAILSNAASFILAHPHPSGEPSPEDIKVTERLQRVGEIIGIDVHDHIILGEDNYISLKEKGFM